MRLTDKLYFYPEKGLLDCNTYVIKDEHALLIDPGFTQFLPSLIRELEEDGIDPKDIKTITNTHLHVDHYMADEPFKEISGAKIVCHPQQLKHYNAGVIKTSRFFGLQVTEFKPDSYLDNDRLTIGEIELELLHCPGHSPDSICFYCRSQKFLICGDVIFNQNTGRVDLPGGSADELKQSIEKLSQLEIEYLLPGHMNILTGAEEIKHNFDYVKKHVFRWL